MNILRRKSVFIMALTLVCLGSPGIALSENKEGFYDGPLSTVAETIKGGKAEEDPAADETLKKKELKKVKGTPRFEQEPVRRPK